MKEEILREIPIFDGLSRNEIKRIAKVLRPREFAASTMLFQEGESADRFFILLEGEIAIIKALGSPNERNLRVCKAGSFVGEMALFEPEEVRSASARAHTAVRLLEMSYTELKALLHRYPALAYEMMRVMSSRLHQSDNKTIIDLSNKNLQLSQAYGALEAAQAELIEKEKIERELEVARTIQQSMLPRRLPSMAGYDLGARMVPARAVGGDFFDFIPLARHTLGIVIGDVSEKGVPAALFMALTSSLIRAEAKRGVSGVEGVRNVNQHLLEINDMGMFVTIWYGVLDGESRELDYVRAGHELPLVCNAVGEFALLPSAQGLPLGVSDEILLDQQTVRLDTGSTLLIYTDGMTDTLDGSGNHFGLERLRRALAGHHRETAQAVCNDLIGVSAGYRGDAPQYDDIALLAVKAL